jgi:hypothetical protein
MSIFKMKAFPVLVVVLLAELAALVSREVPHLAFVISRRAERYCSVVLVLDE